MEPVPETEGMEQFRASPVPSLRLQESSLYEYRSNDRESNKRPPTLRRVTDPIPSSPRSPQMSSALPYRSRNTSPYARGHLRSKSSTSALAPPMSRAQSLPGFNAAGQLLISPQRPSSPLGSPNRVRTPRKPADEVFPGFPTRNLRDISETGGSESPDHTPRPMERSVSPILGLPSSASYTRARRPASPLRHLAQQNASAYSTAPTTPSSINSSPSYQSPKFNEALLGSTNYNAFNYPGSYTSSSVPSTPTSIRSRSPSISSLETIPDSPDAEEEALEAERIAQLKADADAADSGEDSKDKGMDGSGTRGRTLGAGFGRDKRKRWSVCGAERRGDLNLDTIWED
ncbi:hypothetical protein GLAREA_01839 [Glarea lozoyensis ATCC 20868]|uniref:Basic proline-rich protein n=1 Tax=Glarea lozoyensis (strain ATCC 20868 / MF5171) TaxID=1116229 RepID=S3CHH9_GLAL2|nr:uncharacterized protein GLAREA_01839 [Glarea lozoyensis ATCC 20868]EPE25927.1 hypothetical protein GLAREA_01839 [Glarea lozoyensis ATCC 20868]